MQLKHGDRIRLAPGATVLAIYTEYDHEARCVNPKGRYWIGELHLAHGRLTCRQAWNGKRRMNRAWLRKRCTVLLDAIAPGWQVVRTPNAKVTGSPDLSASPSGLPGYAGDNNGERK